MEIIKLDSINASDARVLVTFKSKPNVDKLEFDSKQTFSILDMTMFVLVLLFCLTTISASQEDIFSNESQKVQPRCSLTDLRDEVYDVAYDTMEAANYLWDMFYVG